MFIALHYILLLSFTGSVKYSGNYHYDYICVCCYLHACNINKITDSFDFFTRQPTTCQSERG